MIWTRIWAGQREGYINDAQMIITGILTSNGMIHAIDKVILLPQ